jgi:hypothetical protein
MELIIFVMTVLIYITTDKKKGTETVHNLYSNSENLLWQCHKQAGHNLKL